MARAHALIVEDHDRLAELLGRVASRTGFEPLVVPTVAAAAEALRGRQFGVLITESELPDGDAGAVVAAADAVQPALPAIVLWPNASARAALESRAEFYPSQGLSIFAALVRATGRGRSRTRALARRAPFALCAVGVGGLAASARTRRRLARSLVGVKHPARSFKGALCR